MPVSLANGEKADYSFDELKSRWGIGDSGVRSRLKGMGGYPNPSSRRPVPASVVAAVEWELRAINERRGLGGFH